MATSKGGGAAFGFTEPRGDAFVALAAMVAAVAAALAASVAAVATAVAVRIAARTSSIVLVSGVAGDGGRLAFSASLRRF